MVLGNVKKFNNKIVIKVNEILHIVSIFFKYTFYLSFILCSGSLISCLGYPSVHRSTESTVRIQ